jgi:hypothetical protein
VVIGREVVDFWHANLIPSAAMARGLQTWCPLLVCLAALAVCEGAYASNNGGWYKLNSDCSGGCDIRGSRSDISSPSSFTIVNNQAALEATAIGGSFDPSNTATQWLGEAGFIQINSATNGLTDCDTNNTAPNLVNFTETIEDGVGQCNTGSVNSSSTHLYKAQRKKDSTCVANARPNCVATFVGTDVKQVLSANGDVAYAAQTQGEMIRTCCQGSNDWYNGNTSVTGTYPGGGSTVWQRTSSIFDNGVTDVWTSLSSAHCVDEGTKWAVGSISGGFSITWSPGATSC